MGLADTNFPKFFLKTMILTMIFWGNFLSMEIFLECKWAFTVHYI
jgi:hypothetical protein